MNNFIMLHPYFRDFFGKRKLADAHHHLQTSLKAADSREEWKLGSPGTLQHLYNDLYFLLQSIHPLKDTAGYREADISAHDPQVWSLAQTKFFCEANASLKPWDHFPRYLVRIEYLEPSIIFSRCCSFQMPEQWLILFQHIIECALTSKTIREIYPNTSLLPIVALLHKLIDALHLFRVRVKDHQPDQMIPFDKLIAKALNNSATEKKPVFTKSEFMNKALNTRTERLDLINRLGKVKDPQPPREG